MFIVIENGEVYGPEPLGRVSVLLNGGTILKIGEVDASAIEKSGLPIEVIDGARRGKTSGKGRGASTRIRTALQGGAKARQMHWITAQNVV